MRLALHLALTALRSISGGIMTLEERLEPTGTNEPPRRSFTGASWAPVPDVIENPVINSPYEGPRRHFVFGNEASLTRLPRDVVRARSSSPSPHRSRRRPSSRSRV